MNWHVVWLAILTLACPGASATTLALPPLSGGTNQIPFSFPSSALRLQSSTDK